MVIRAIGGDYQQFTELIIQVQIQLVNTLSTFGNRITEFAGVAVVFIFKEQRGLDNPKL